MTILKSLTLGLAGLLTAALVAWGAPALASHGADDPAGHDRGDRHGQHHRHHHGHHGHHHGHHGHHHGHGADDPAGHDAGDDHGSGGHGADD